MNERQMAGGQVTLNNRKWQNTSSAPFHGSSWPQFVYGGALPGISLATGNFTGESTRNPARGDRDF